MKISKIPKNGFFVVTNLTVNFVGFLFLSTKVNADVINDRQYCEAKMATKSDIYLKYDHAIYVWAKYEYKHRLSIKTAK